MHLKNTLALLLLSFSLVFTNLSCQEAAKNATCQTYSELPDPTSDTLSDWSGVPEGLHASFVSIDKRYPKSLKPEISLRADQKVQGWKGETVSAQLLLWTVDSLSSVKVTFSDFQGEESELPADIAEARFVRYVMTDEFAGGCGVRKPEDFDSSLSADALDNISCMDLGAKKVRPVWLTVRIPDDAHEGKYHTTVTVSGNDAEAQKLELQLEVINQVLPPASEWKFHLDLWQHPSAVARMENVKLWSDEHFEAMKPVMKLLADAGQKVITATLNKDPWNVQTYDPYADMIIWTKGKKGDWSYDYTVFDRWVEFMMALGVKDEINCYSIIPWNNELHYKDAATGKFVDVKADPGTPVFDSMWRPFLKDFSMHLKEKGWLKITNIAMDERDPKSLDIAFKIIKKVAPGLGVAFADNHKTYKKYPNSDDISISVIHPFDKADLIDRRKRGLITTFYIYCGNSFPNTLTFSDPAEAAYLGWYTLASGFDGFLRWSFNSWVKGPLKDSRFRTWPAGDTYMVYPGGRSSIRYERMLEGIQDYVKARIVREKLKEEGKTQALKDFNEAIEKLNNVQKHASWNEDLNQAKKMLNDLSREV